MVRHQFKKPANYYNKKKRIAVRKKFYMNEKYGKKIGKFADSFVPIPYWQNKVNPFRFKRAGKHMGRQLDYTGYKHHLWLNGIREYRRIGSKPSRYNTGKVGSRPYSK